MMIIYHASVQEEYIEIGPMILTAMHIGTKRLPSVWRSNTRLECISLLF